MVKCTDPEIKSKKGKNQCVTVGQNKYQVTHTTSGFGVLQAYILFIITPSCFICHLPVRSVGSSSVCFGFLGFGALNESVGETSGHLDRAVENGCRAPRS